MCFSGIIHGLSTYGKGIITLYNATRSPTIGGNVKALVYRGERMAGEDVADPEPGPGEVLLKVRYCGICGSDVHLLSRGIFLRGAIPGHEGSAEGASLGPEVSGWEA